MLLYFDHYADQSRRLADALNLPSQCIARHRFPDGEYRLTLPPALPQQLIFCSSLNEPNEKLIELLLAARSARQSGVRSLTLVAPYLCYMRQDIAFHPGEVVSQGIIGHFLADLFDNIITVDPHLHRITRLEQAVPAKHALALSATSLMAEFLHERSAQPILLGPDNESSQWVAAIARNNQWTHGVCEKKRSGDRQVAINLPDIELEDRAVVLVDDVASSGRTLAVAATECLRRGASRVDVLVTHALFMEDALETISRAGVLNIWSTDSVAHPSNVISLTPLLAAAVRNL